ncbi:hypothetical protein L6452_11999 [Arctium lappa]|uniref:Uncharacterized protein n=1 Tax=Arctium lappa TaxID=4217 RepID=A0ACB9DQG6_ARCLA|nr:hypothetical protein L6452_11999 [Arctium lappa]
MERRFSTIIDIQPGMKNPWTVLVQVVEPMQTSKAGKLAKHAETESHQNVQAIVVRCFPSEEQEHVSGVIMKQDVVIVNGEKRPIILTSWNYFADNEGQILENLIYPPAMIFGLRLKVSSFNGLDDRYHENRAEIEKLLDQKAFRNMDTLLPPPKQTDIIPIATYLANLKTTSWIGGRITVLPQEKSCTQTGYADCLKPLEVDLTWIVQCPTCKKECEVQLM